MYLSADRNKRSMTVALAHLEGQSLIRHLVEKSDVLIENCKVGDFRRYGPDYTSLKALNRRLVNCARAGDLVRPALM